MLAQLALAILIASNQVKGDSDGGGGGHGVEKRSVSVLARTGGLPFQPGKRYVAALARNGELSGYPRPAWSKKLHDHSLEELEERLEEEGVEKRYLGSLARAGDLRGLREEKREDEGVRDELEGLLRELAGGGEDGRRLLRLEALREELGEEAAATGDDDYPADDFYSSEEKRGGISSLARGGGLPKRSSDDDLEELMSEVYGIDDDKRNVASLARGSFLKSGGKRADDGWDEEKRNLPSLLKDRSHPLGEGKRNLASLARARDFPLKRDWAEEGPVEMSKRYVAALLRQGRLPVGDQQSDEDSAEKETASAADGETAKEEESQPRRKKSVEEPQAKRAKRETFVPLPGLASDYILPVARDDGFARFDDDKWADDLTSPINKRYFAVRGGGKIPGGRLPQIGRRGGRHGGSRNGRRGGH